MIHVILKCPLNLAAAVILVIMALNSPVESKTISPSLVRKLFLRLFYLPFFFPFFP